MRLTGPQHGRVQPHVAECVGLSTCETGHDKGTLPSTEPGQVRNAKFGWNACNICRPLIKLPRVGDANASRNEPQHKVHQSFWWLPTCWSTESSLNDILLGYGLGERERTHRRRGNLRRSLLRILAERFAWIVSKIVSINVVGPVRGWNLIALGDGSTLSSDISVFFWLDTHPLDKADASPVNIVRIARTGSAYMSNAAVSCDLVSAKLSKGCLSVRGTLNSFRSARLPGCGCAISLTPCYSQGGFASSCTNEFNGQWLIVHPGRRSECLLEALIQMAEYPRC